MLKTLKRVIGIDFGNWNAFVCFIENMDAKTRMGGRIIDLIPDKYREMGQTGIPNEFFWGIINSSDGKITEKEFFGFEAARSTNYPPENHRRLLKRNIKNKVTLHAGAKNEHSRTFEYKDLIIKAFAYIAGVANDALRESYGEDATTNLVSITYPAVLGDPSSLRYFVELAEQADSGARDKNGKMLKIKVVGTICEPAAAGLDRLSEQRESTHKEIETYGVCDFGGGTFDLSIVSLYPKGRKYADGSLYYFDIVGSAEGLNIGGNDFTGILETLFNSKLEKTIKKAPSAGNKRTTKREAEKCKLDLSSEGVNEAVIYYDVDDDTVEIRVSRDEFEKAIASKVKEVTDYTRDFFDRHKNHLPDVIIMTGGTSYIPYVQEQLKRALPEFRDRIFLHRPSKAAAYGAARFYNPVPEAVKNTEGGKNKETGEKTTPGIVRKSVPHDIATKVVVGGYTVMETLISAGTELPCDSGEREFISRKAGAKATDYDIYQANKKNPVKSRIKEDYDIIHEAKLEHPNALSNQKTSTRCRVSIDSLGMIRLKAWAKDNSDIRIEHDFKLNGN